MTKLEALAKHLECDIEDLDDCDGQTFDYRNGRQTYMVLTDLEADEIAKELILDSVWAFDASFLAAHAIDGIGQDVIESIHANNRCESNTKALTALIKDVQHFVTDAILSDGRGHFISSYDGEEHEIGEYLIYRTN